MQRVAYKYTLISTSLFSLLVIFSVNTVLAQSRPQVPSFYQSFFKHYVDNRSISERALNLVNLTSQEVGRSFALIAGVSRYPNMSLLNQELQPARTDIKNLFDYLKNNEFFDEIVVLQDGDVSIENINFFLHTYFPRQLAKYPKSRFIFAYSGHGMTKGSRGYLLQSTARSLTDLDNSISLAAVRAFIDEVVASGHHVLVLLNSCYSGAFLKRGISFGGQKRLLQKYSGAHAITAGGTGEQSWHIPSVGSGSVFFEKVFAGLDKRADSSGDGIISVYELFAYLKQEVQLSTDQNQNPMIGDLTINGSKGEFFFLNRDIQVSSGVAPPWRPENNILFGAQSEEIYKNGIENYKAGKYEAALTLFKKAADDGITRALVYIAHMYIHGEGTQKDYQKAFQLLQYAADAGDDFGMSKLAWSYRNGLGIAQDNVKAVYWNQKAADLGNIASMTNLAKMYRDGLGVTQDYSKSEYWYSKAANAGDAIAMEAMGDQYRLGLGVTKNYSKAASWYYKAANLGLVHSMASLGQLYRNGLGVKKDYSKAAIWYSKAAYAGDAVAMSNIAFLYRKGYGVEQSDDKAAYWFKKAAEAEEPFAMSYLGCFYRDGRSVSQDYSKAAYWFSKAANAGDVTAMRNLGSLYREGLGVVRDSSMAIFWYKKAAKLGDEHSEKMLKVLNQ